MTPEKLSEWKKLAEAATEGPWYADITRSGPGAAVCHSEAVSTVAYPSREICKFPHKDLSAVKTMAGRAANFDFIAAARTAVPELIAEVERLQRIIRRADEVKPCAVCGSKLMWAYAGDATLATECKTGERHKCPMHE